MSKIARDGQMPAHEARVAVARLPAEICLVRLAEGDLGADTPGRVPRTRPRAVEDNEVVAAPATRPPIAFPMRPAPISATFIAAASRRRTCPYKDLVSPAPLTTLLAPNHEFVLTVRHALRPWCGAIEIATIRPPTPAELGESLVALIRNRFW